MAIGGLDIGTSRCKITVYDDRGNYLYKAYRDYPVSGRMREHEVHAESVWTAVKEVIREAAEEYPDIRGIGVTSFGETFVLLDRDSMPVCPSMLYTDPRGSMECRMLADKIGSRKIALITGLKPHSMYSISKLMWLRKNRPDDYAKAKHVMLMEDYIVYMLTGNAQIDYSLASRTMAFDIRNLCWSEEIFAAADIEMSLFSKTVPTGTSAGCVKGCAAEELRLRKDTIIVSAGHDQVAAAIGSGVYDDGEAVDGAGTVQCITPVFDRIPDSSVFYDGSYAIVPYVFPGKYVCYAFSFTGGALVKWYIDNLAKKEKTIAESQGKSVFEVLEAGMKDEPTGILVLPHFAGAGTPYMDSDSKGAVVGITVSHTVSDLYRAMMEGVTYEMLLNIEKLKEAGINVQMLRAAGGGAASQVWMQMKADILNVPVVSLGSAEAGAAGCAMMAGIAAGIFEDVKSAAALLIKEKNVYKPREKQHIAYMKYYDRYKELYKAVRPLV